MPCRLSPSSRASSPVRRTNSSSSRLLLVRIERTRMPASSSAANTRLRSIARGMSRSSVWSSLATSVVPSIARQLRRQRAVDVEHEAFDVELGQQRAHRPLLDDGAAVDDRQVAAQALGFLQVMRGQDDGGAGGVDLLSVFHMPRRISMSTPAVGSSRISSRGRVIIARAIISRRFMPPDSVRDMHVRLVPQLGALELLLGAHQRLGARQAVEAGVVDQDVERLLEHVEVQLLRHQAEQAHGGVAVAWPGRRRTPRTSPARLVDQRTDDADQGRLAGAVGAEQGEEIARRDLQRHALERLARRCRRSCAGR